MANPKHLAKLKKGISSIHSRRRLHPLAADEWNTWRKSNHTIVPDLSGADLSWMELSGNSFSRVDLTGVDLTGVDLSGANLIGADLSEVNLSGADLQEANLTLAHLIGANLSGAKLSGADLGGARLIGANLSQTDLCGAILFGAILIGANLSQTDLCGAKLLETIFGNTILKEVQGLETCDHFGPSVLDHRTLAKSDPLPLPFLRGCGLPDEFIEYLPSLLNQDQAIQLYSCFISYSTTDQAFAERLYADLQNKGVRCWFAPHDIRGGKKLHEQIDEAIRVYDRLLLILSEASMNSEWVKTEIANARHKEVSDGGRVLFPISLVSFETVRGWKNFDAATGKDSAREICEYYIPDFSDWKNHDNYQAAFERLLKGLKTEYSLLNP